MNFRQLFEKAKANDRKAETTTPVPQAAAIDRRSEPKSPVPIQMRYAHQWLCSFDMEFRRRGRSVPESKCRLLFDWLPDDKRKELEKCGDLSWRDWNAVFDWLIFVVSLRACESKESPIQY